MTSSKTAIVAVALCVALQIATSQGTVTTVAEKSKSFGNNQLIFDSKSFENATFVYASCRPVQGKTDKTCKVYLAINDLEPTKECSLTLSLRNDNREISPYMRIFLLGKNSAVMTYTIVDKNPNTPENSKQSRPPRIRIAIVNMSTCEVKDVTRIDLRKKDNQLDARSMEVIPYDNTFDVIFESRTVCQDKYCRVTIDDKGMKWTEDIPWFTTFGGFLLIEPLERQSSKKGHLLINVGMRGENQQIALVKDNQIKDLETPSTRVQPIALSTSNNAASICYVDPSESSNYKITCMQYDSVTGKTKYKTSIKLGYATYFVALYNRPNGDGFLLMTPKCSNTYCSGTINRYHVNGIDASGHVFAHLVFNGPECPSGSGLASKFYMNEAKQYCLTVVCYATNIIKQAPDSDEWLKFATNCFDLK